MTLSVIAQGIIGPIIARTASAQSQLCHRAKRRYLGLFVWFIARGILYRHFDLFTVHFGAPSRLGELLTIVTCSDPSVKAKIASAVSGFEAVNYCLHLAFLAYEKRLPLTLAGARHDIFKPEIDPKEYP